MEHGQTFVSMFIRLNPTHPIYEAPLYLCENLAPEGLTLEGSYFSKLLI